MNAPILPARLVLEDGSVFHGRSFGKPGEVIACVVFRPVMQLSMACSRQITW